VRQLLEKMVDLVGALESDTREQFAGRSGTSASTLSKVLAGSVDPPPDLQERICKSLGVSADVSTRTALFRKGQADAACMKKFVELVMASPSRSDAERGLVAAAIVSAVRSNRRR